MSGLGVPDARLLDTLLSGLRPGVAILAATGRGNADGEPVQGALADVICRQAGLLKPGRLLLGKSGYALF